MGGAVFTSLDGETTFASLPERVEVALRGALGAASDKLGARKSDRLPTAEEPSVARQVIRVSTTRARATTSRARASFRARRRQPRARRHPTSRPTSRRSIRSACWPTPIASATPEDAPAAEPDAEVSFVMRDLRRCCRK